MKRRELIRHLERFGCALLDEGAKHSRYINRADPRRSPKDRLMDRITRADVITNLSDYFDHRITLADLVHWAEEAMQEGAFAGRDAALLRDGVARFGVADVRVFALAWEDCEELPLPHHTREREG